MRRTVKVRTDVHTDKLELNKYIYIYILYIDAWLDTVDTRRWKDGKFAWSRRILAFNNL